MRRYLQNMILIDDGKKNIQAAMGLYTAIEVDLDDFTQNYLSQLSELVGLTHYADSVMNSKTLIASDLLEKRVLALGHFLFKHIHNDYADRLLNECRGVFAKVAAEHRASLLHRKFSTLSSRQREALLTNVIKPLTDSRDRFSKQIYDLLNTFLELNHSISTGMIHHQMESAKKSLKSVEETLKEAKKNQNTAAYDNIRDRFAGTLSNVVKDNGALSHLGGYDVGLHYEGIHENGEQEVSVEDLATIEARGIFNNRFSALYHHMRLQVARIDTLRMLSYDGLSTRPTAPACYAQQLHLSLKQAISRTILFYAKDFEGHITINKDQVDPNALQGEQRQAVSRQLVNNKIVTDHCIRLIKSAASYGSRDALNMALQLAIGKNNQSLMIDFDQRIDLAKFFLQRISLGDEAACKEPINKRWGFKHTILDALGKHANTREKKEACKALAQQTQIDIDPVASHKQFTGAFKYKIPFIKPPFEKESLPSIAHDTTHTPKGLKR